jgi:hypothetical protein
VNEKGNGRTGRRSFIKATGALGVGTGVALTSGASAVAATGPDAGIDSFDNLGGGVILNPGASAFWSYSHGGADRGFQIAGPSALPPLNGARFTFFDAGKSVAANGFTTYFVTIRNDGAVAAVHNLEGGGLI